MDQPEPEIGLITNDVSDSHFFTFSRHETEGKFVHLHVTSHFEPHVNRLQAAIIQYGSTVYRGGMTRSHERMGLYREII